MVSTHRVDTHWPAAVSVIRLINSEINLILRFSHRPAATRPCGQWHRTLASCAHWPAAVASKNNIILRLIIILRSDSAAPATRPYGQWCTALAQCTHWPAAVASIIIFNSEINLILRLSYERAPAPRRTVNAADASASAVIGQRPSHLNINLILRLIILRLIIDLPTAATSRCGQW